MWFSVPARRLAAAIIVTVLAGAAAASGAMAQGSLPAPSAAPILVPHTAPAEAGASKSPLAHAPAVSPAAGEPSAIRDENYKLGTGDKIRLVFYREEDLGGEYLVNSTGEVQLPLVGQMQAAGMTLHDFQASLTAKFVAEGYLKDPRISVEVLNYRPFYIMGEVKAPGQYPYISGMSVLNAVVLAGGYTYRANDSVVYLRRNGDDKEIKVPADQTTKVNPGDIIRVDERIF
jgi:protein involved in polysaccharide export with SLBB domain